MGWKKEPFNEMGWNLSKLSTGTEVYILESGRLAFVQNKERKYDTSKSISAYGEYGTCEERNISIPDANSISTHTNDIRNMLLTKLKETR